MLVTRYKVKDYTRQRICLTEKDIKTLFETVLPEKQRTLLGFSADVCEKMIKERTGSSKGKNGYLDGFNGKAKKAKAENGAKGEKSRNLKKEVKREKAKKKRISLDEFFGG